MAAANEEELDQQWLAQQLLAQAKEQGVELVGPDRLLNQLTKRVLETALEEEMAIDDQVRNKPIYVVIGVTVRGERDILGLWSGDGGEGAKFWLQVPTKYDRHCAWYWARIGHATAACSIPTEI